MIKKECPVCGKVFEYTEVCPACDAELKEVIQYETDSVPKED